MYDMAGEALALTMLNTPPVINLVKLHWCRSQRHLARLGATIAHHQSVPMLVARAAITLLDLSGGLGSERFDQLCPPARAISSHSKSSSPASLSRLPSASVASPSHRLPLGIGVCSRGRVRRLFHARIRSTTFGNSSENNKVTLAFGRPGIPSQP